MKTFELYFDDLTEETQRRYLKFQQVDNADELNWEIASLAIIDREESEETEWKHKNAS